MAFVKYKNISGYARDRYRADRSNHEKRCTGEPSSAFCVCSDLQSIVRCQQRAVALNDAFAGNKLALPEAA
jgi:hypothetical protein